MKPKNRLPIIHTLASYYQKVKVGPKQTKNSLVFHNFQSADTGRIVKESYAERYLEKVIKHTFNRG